MSKEHPITGEPDLSFWQDILFVKLAFLTFPFVYAYIVFVIVKNLTGSSWLLPYCALIILFAYYAR